MARFLAVLLAVVVLSASLPAHAQYTPLGKDPELTTNPDHKGYGYDKEFEEYYPVEWDPITARCEECQTLADAYNKTVRQLLFTRFWIQQIGDDVRQRDSIMRGLRKMGGMNDTPGDLTAADERRASARINYNEAVDTMAGKLPALEAQEESLKALADDLRAELQQCEGSMCQTGDAKESLRIGDKPAKVNVPLPFDWKGPYPEVCTKCAKLAARLNELPTLARFAMAGLESARADLMYAETEIAALQAFHDGIVFSYEGDTRSPEDILDAHKKSEKKVKKDIAEMEKMKEAAEAEIAKYEADLDAITRNFNETLALYNECVPTCQGEPKKEAMKVGANIAPMDGAKCFASLDLNPFTIGANSEYGTGAAIKDKVQGAATGAAMGALGSVLGGSGISLGGGGKKDDGGGSSDGPKTHKNPLGSKNYGEPYSWSGFYIGTQAGYGFGDSSDNLLVSQKIFDSPGDNSTFHSMWLESPDGKVMLPKRTWIYSIYVDHKLTVWWTYDHWTNGVHDYHDEGEESYSWRTNHGTFRLFDGAQGVENSLWYQSGYNTAAKGVKEVGAEFDLSLDSFLNMGGKCGVGLVTHLTDPNADPVVTIPTATRLFADIPQTDEGGYRTRMPLTLMTEPFRF